MSKDTPEVGDVWQFGRKEYHILNVGKYEDVFFGEVDGVRVIDRGCNKIELLKTKIFAKEGIYLGKAKANIEDLFKTENKND